MVAKNILDLDRYTLVHSFMKYFISKPKEPASAEWEADAEKVTIKDDEDDKKPPKKKPLEVPTILVWLYDTPCH